MCDCYIGTCEKRYETDSPLWVRRIASARIILTSMHCGEETKDVVSITFELASGNGKANPLGAEVSKERKESIKRMEESIKRTEGKYQENGRKYQKNGRKVSREWKKVSKERKEISKNRKDQHPSDSVTFDTIRSQF